MTRKNLLSRFLVYLSCLAILALASGTARAQFLSHNYKGDFGLLAGTQQPPGWYVAAAYVNYSSDTLRDSDANRVLAQR